MSGEVIVRFLSVDMVGLCRIEPPAVVADVTENAFIQIFPINVPCFGIVDVVGACATLWRPGIKIDNHAFGIQLLALLCVGTKAGPCHNHQLGIQFVYFVGPLLGIGKALRVKAV